MPHVVVKLAARRTKEQKQRIPEAVTQAIVQTSDCGDDAVSVAIEDVAKADWDAKAFVPEIVS